MGQSEPGRKNEKTGIGRQRMYSQAGNTNDERGEQRVEKYVNHLELKPGEKNLPSTSIPREMKCVARKDPEQELDSKSIMQGGTQLRDTER